MTDFPGLQNRLRLTSAPVLTLLFAVWLQAGVAAQTPTPATPAQPTQAAEGKPVDRLQFSSDGAIVTYFVRAGALQDFRKIIASWRDTAAASQDPHVAAQLRGWRLYQGAQRGPRDSVVLMSVIYPVIPDADYTLPVDASLAGLPASGAESDLLVGLSRTELELVVDFAKDVPAPSSGLSTARPAAPAGGPFTFGSDAAVLTLFIKSERTAGFEQVVRRVHEGLAASRDRMRLEQAAGWKLFRSREAGPNGTVMYLSIIAPVVKGAEYSVPQLLQEAYPQDVQQLLPQYRDAMAGMSRTELHLLEDFSPAMHPAPAAPPAR